MNSKILAIHGGHDCSVTCVDKNNQLRIFQLERFTKIKHCSFKKFRKENEQDSKFEDRVKFLDYIKFQLKEEPTYILYSVVIDEDFSLMKRLFPNSKFISMGHHTSHCIGAYHQSGFKDALVISLDGGGLENNHYGIVKNPQQCPLIGYSILKISDQKVDVLLTLNSSNAMVFTPGQYASPLQLISEIEDKNKTDHLEKMFDSNQKYVSADYLNSNAGKLMGLVAYGNVRKEWIDVIKQNYMMTPADAQNPMVSIMVGQQMISTLLSNREENEDVISAFLSDNQNSLDDITTLLKSTINCLSGKHSYDLAATNQHVFEELCWKLIKPYLDKYDFDVVFSGGCALNVIFNQKVAEHLNKTNRKLFVSPNPGDDGLSYGHFCSIDKTMNDKFSVYCGFDILDREKIPEYYDKYSKIDKVVDMNVSKIVDLIKEGKIGATMIGYSEVGPRALGNRSIICDPSIPEMKDTLNAKVKFREWFRPFGPVCREEDKDIYFDNAFASPYMSFAPLVKEEYRQKLPAITHVDGTARLQTVTRDQHELFYDILTELDNRGHDAVILNTSFNIKGNPILTTVEDAFYVLENTELDFLILEDYLFLK
jgi:predicted NodU family carbamoyl transferase